MKIFSFHKASLYYSICLYYHLNHKDLYNFSYCFSTNLNDDAEKTHYENRFLDELKINYLSILIYFKKHVNKLFFLLIFL